MSLLLVARAWKLLYLGVLQEVQGGHAENPYLRNKLKRLQKQSWTRKFTDLKPEARRKTDLKPEAVVHKQTWNRKLWYTNRLEAGSCRSQTDLILEVVLLKHTGIQKLWFTHWPKPEALMLEQTCLRKLHCTNTLKPEAFVHTLVWTGSCDARTDLTPEPVVKPGTGRFFAALIDNFV